MRTDFRRPRRPRRSQISEICDFEPVVIFSSIPSVTNSPETHSKTSMKNLVSVTSVMLLLCWNAATASLHHLRTEQRRDLSSQEIERENENESSSITKDRNLQLAKVVGNNGRGGVFPLELCQGDCDSDDDCLGDLVCFQRNAGQPIPGCAGGEHVSERADFCVQNPSDGDGGDDNGGGDGDDDGNAFALKLYWQSGTSSMSLLALHRKQNHDPHELPILLQCYLS
jgi:hypothetical protein